MNITYGGNKMKLVPLADRVVLKQSTPEEKTKSGIILTSQTQEKPQQAEVVAVGPGGVIDGKEVTMTVKVGDKVTVKVTFDKEATASIAFNVKGKWKASKALKGKTITYTGTPGDDYVGIQLNEMPKNYGYVLIKNIEISSKGKTNYDNAVTTSGSGAAIVTSSTKTVAANAGLSDKNIKKGKKVNIDSKITTLSSANKKIATATVNEYSKKTNAKYNIYDKAVNLNLKVAGKKVNTTKKEIEFKIEKPKSLDASKYDFAVVAISNGKAVLIPDTDSRDEIITFKTTKFDTIAIVYGDKDCFKELKGDKSLHTFTKEWVGYETEFSTASTQLEIL